MLSFGRGLKRTSFVHICSYCVIGTRVGICRLVVFPSTGEGGGMLTDISGRLGVFKEHQASGGSLYKKVSGS